MIIFLDIQPQEVALFFSLPVFNCLQVVEHG